MQTYYNTLFCPSKHEHDYSFLGLKMNQKKTMDVHN